MENLQFLNSCLGSKSIMLTEQSPKSVSIKPIGPGHTPWVSENMHVSGLILSTKYLSSFERVTIVLGSIFTVRAGPLFDFGNTGKGDIL